MLELHLKKDRQNIRVKSAKQNLNFILATVNLCESQDEIQAQGKES
jgi:hypothetical protein